MKNSNKIIAIILAALLLLVCVIPLSASGIHINIKYAYRTTTVVNVGDRFTLSLNTSDRINSTSWSSSDSSVAKIVKQNNKLSADINPVAPGVAIISIKIDYSSWLKNDETVNFKVYVYEKKQISIKPYEQQTNYCCSASATRSTLRGIGVKYNGDDLTLYKSLGSITIGSIANKIKALSGKNYYAKAFYSRTEFEKAVIASIKKGCPVVIKIALKDTSSPFKYKTTGHFTCISGFTVSPSGEVQFSLCDSFRIATNGGTFMVSSSDLYAYARTNYNSNTGKYVANGCGCWIAAAK